MFLQKKELAALNKKLKDELDGKRICILLCVKVAAELVTETQGELAHIRLVTAHFQTLFKLLVFDTCS